MQKTDYFVLALLAIATIISLITWIDSKGTFDFTEGNCEILDVKYTCLGKMERVSHLEFLEWLGSLIGL